MTMTLTPYQQNVLAIIDRHVRRCVSVHLRKTLRTPVRDAVMKVNTYDPVTMHITSTGPDLNKFMNWLATLPSLKSEDLRGVTSMRSIIYRSVNCKIPQQQLISRMADEVVRQMATNITALEMECHLPPARRERTKTAAPTTLVERRAVSARAKLQRWESKLKYAKAKVKKYGRKVAYYTKKGVL